MKQSVRVTWEIDVEADSAEEAAEIAFHHAQRPGTSANVFDVFYPDGSNVHVDLTELEQEREMPLELLDAPNLLKVAKAVIYLESAIEALMDIEGVDRDDREMKLLKLSSETLAQHFADWSNASERRWVSLRLGQADISFAPEPETT
jgi:hypothetical protein